MLLLGGAVAVVLKGCDALISAYRSEEQNKLMLLSVSKVEWQAS